MQEIKVPKNFSGNHVSYKNFLLTKTAHALQNVAFNAVGAWLTPVSPAVTAAFRPALSLALFALLLREDCYDWEPR